MPLSRAARPLLLAHHVSRERGVDTSQLRQLRLTLCADAVAAQAQARERGVATEALRQPRRTCSTDVVFSLRLVSTALTRRLSASCAAPSSPISLRSSFKLVSVALTRRLSAAAHARRAAQRCRRRRPPQWPYRLGAQCIHRRKCPCSRQQKLKESQGLSTTTAEKGGFRRSM